jgi:hypothetical protein
MKNTEKQYNSLGEMIKERDFQTLYNKLVQYEQTPDQPEMKQLSQIQTHCSELDLMLFNIARFATPKQTKKQKMKEENEVEDDFLDTILTDDNLEITDSKAKLMPFVLEVLDVLLRNGANPNVAIVNGVTPFLAACTVNNAEFMEKLVNNPYKTMDLKTGEYIYFQADIEQGDGKGHRPFYYATMSQATDVMDVLVNQYQVDPNFQYMFYDNKTAFHLVCLNLADEVKLDPDGLTFIATEGETKDKAIDKLIELNVDPTILDDYENVPEECVPVFDDEIHDEGDITEEELKMWDNTYEKIGNYRKAFEANHKTTHKLSF